jgi:hypothetical protein
MSEAPPAPLAPKEGAAMEEILSSALRPPVHPVEAWLQTLSERKRSAMLQYTAAEKSTVLSYLYASALGHQGSIDDWEAWVNRKWNKLDHRAILENEIASLKTDIDGIRTAVEDKVIKRGDAPTKISYLSKELRGHIETLSRDITSHDRCSLILAGVEVASKMLRKVYGRDASAWPAIESCLDAAWADIESRHKAK